MATAHATRPAPEPRALPAGAHDRAFYTGMAVAMAVTVFAGFAPTYYLRVLGAGPAVTISGSSLTPVYHLHALLFTGWVLLFVAQTALVATRRVALHRRLGVAGALLAAVMVVVGTGTALTTAARGAAPPGVDPLVFLAVPLFDMLLFAVFVTAALLKRSDAQAHKRLMLLAYVSIMAAAVARLPGVLPLGPFVFFGGAYLFGLAGAIYDLVSRRRVHPVYVWGLAFLAASVPGRLTIAGTGAWRAFAEAVTR